MLQDDTAYGQIFGESKRQSGECKPPCHNTVVGLTNTAFHGVSGSLTRHSCELVALKAFRWRSLLIMWSASDPCRFQGPSRRTDWVPRDLTRTTTQVCSVFGCCLPCQGEFPLSAPLDSCLRSRHSNSCHGSSCWVLLLCCLSCLSVATVGLSSHRLTLLYYSRVIAV